MSSIDAKLILIIYTDRQNRDSVVYMAAHTFVMSCVSISMSNRPSAVALALALALAIGPSAVDLKRASGGKKTKLGRQLRNS